MWGVCLPVAEASALPITPRACPSMVWGLPRLWASVGGRVSTNADPMLTFLTLHQTGLRAGADVESTSSAIGACLEVVPGYVLVGLSTALRRTGPRV